MTTPRGPTTKIAFSSMSYVGMTGAAPKEFQYHYLNTFQAWNTMRAQLGRPPYPWRSSWIGKSTTISMGSGNGLLWKTHSENWDDLKELAREAVRCHLDTGRVPRVIRLHLVRGGGIVVRGCFATSRAPTPQGGTVGALDRSGRACRLWGIVRPWRHAAYCSVGMLADVPLRCSPVSARPPRLRGRGTQLP